MLYQLLFQCPTLAGAHATQVFQAEYNLMCDIASCPVPYVSLCDGIWMGLGVGLAVHGNVSTALALQHADSHSRQNPLRLAPQFRLCSVKSGPSKSIHGPYKHCQHSTRTP